MQLEQAEADNYFISNENNNLLKIDTFNYFMKSNIETKQNKKDENIEDFFLGVPVEVIKDNFGPITYDGIDNYFEIISNPFFFIFLSIHHDKIIFNKSRKKTHKGV